MRLPVHGPMLHCRACRKYPEVVVALPIARWAIWTYREAPTAVRANVFQNTRDARIAKRAFERADHRLGRLGRQFLVAVLTCRSQLEHGSILCRKCQNVEPP